MGIKSIVTCFVFLFFLIAAPVRAQEAISTPDSTGSHNSKLVLNELWTKNFEKNTNVYSAYVLSSPDQKFKNVIVNSSQLKTTNDKYFFWSPKISLFDLNGDAKDESSKDSMVYVSSHDKKIFFGDSGWRMEGSDGHSVKQSTEEMFNVNLFFSPDDSLLVGLDEDNNAALYDSEGNLIKKFSGSIGCIGDVCFSPDSQFIGLGSFVTNKPGLEKKFWLVDRDGNDVFELPLDSQGGRCFFSADGSRIAVLSWKSLYVTDLKGNVISQITKPHVVFGEGIFLNNNSLVVTGGANIWKVNLSKGTAKVERIQKNDYSGSIRRIGNDFVATYSINKDSGLEIISPTGQVLASTKLPSALSGIQVKGDYIVAWSNRSLSLFKVSEE